MSPADLLASASGQKIRFTVALSERVEGASLVVRLPRAWTGTAQGGLPFARAPRLSGSAGGRARLRRSGRSVELAFDQASANDTASFEVTDVGIPAGSYELPFAWRDVAGRTRRAGTVRVVFRAPIREGEKRNPFAGLRTPRIEQNATAAAEESETFIAAKPGDPNRVAVGVNGPDFSAYLSGDGGQTWQKRTVPSTIDVPGSSTDQTHSICCDPAYAGDSLGNIWYGGLSFSGGAGAPSRIVVNRIGAGTSSFQPKTVGLPRRGSGQQDKPMMTIDSAPGSPTFGRLYVVWNEPAAGGAINLVISQCDTRSGPISNPANCDNADNWSSPVSVTQSPGSYIYGDVAVGPDGKAYVTWWDYSSTNAIRGADLRSGRGDLLDECGVGGADYDCQSRRDGRHPGALCLPDRGSAGRKGCSLTAGRGRSFGRAAERAGVRDLGRSPLR